MTPEAAANVTVPAPVRSITSGSVPVRPAGTVIVIAVAWFAS